MIAEKNERIPKENVIQNTFENPECLKRICFDDFCACFTWSRVDVFEQKYNFLNQGEVIDSLFPFPVHRILKCLCECSQSVAYEQSDTVSNYALVQDVIYVMVNLNGFETIKWILE